MSDNTPQDPELRRKAARRSLLCAGAGFALLGHRRLAVASVVVSGGLVLACLWVALQPVAVAVYATGALFVLYSLLVLTERIAAKKGRLGCPGPRLLTERYLALGLGQLVGAGVCLVAFLASYGSLRMAGSGMSPTLEENDRLLYYKRVDREAIKPGALIVFANASDSGWGKPGWLVVSRILAGPGDTLSIEGRNYLLNGKVVSKVGAIGSYPVRLEVPKTPEALVVPDDCYFVVQDAPGRGFDSRVLSWVRNQSILGNRIWQLSRPGLLTRVK